MGILLGRNYVPKKVPGPFGKGIVHRIACGHESGLGFEGISGRIMLSRACRV